MAAEGFINISTSEAKKDIGFLADEDEDEILQKIASTSVATYYYNSDSECSALTEVRPPLANGGLTSVSGVRDSCAKKRLGLIAEEAPLEILSVDGKGVDLYKMTSFVWAGLKAQQRQIDKLADEIAELKLQLSSLATSTDSQSNSFQLFTFDQFIDAFKNIGIVITSGANKLIKLVASEIEVAALRINPEIQNPVAPTSQANYKTIGEGEIAAGASEVFIETDAAELGSKIFVTPLTITEQPLAVTQIEACAAPHGFKVQIKNPAGETVKFNWWLVQTGPKQECPAPPEPEAQPQPEPLPADLSAEAPPSGTEEEAPTEQSVIEQPVVEQPPVEAPAEPEPTEPAVVPSTSTEASTEVRPPLVATEPTEPTPTD